MLIVFCIITGIQLQWKWKDGNQTQNRLWMKPYTQLGNLGHNIQCHLPLSLSLCNFQASEHRHKRLFCRMQLMVYRYYILIFHFQLRNNNIMF
jgi:hypothetical protein